MIMLVLLKKRAFRKYVSTYSVATMDRESLMDTLDLSRNSINELFTDLLRERRGFKYFLTARVTLKKRQGNNFISVELILIQKQKQ